jgi:hypothetical protein
MTKKPNKIQEPFAAYPIAMLDSPAWRVLSRAGHQFLARLAIEQWQHGGKIGDGLPLTHEQLQEYGMHPDSTAPAMRECEALGLAKRLKQGRGGNSEYRQANEWRTTFLQSRDSLPTDEWRKIETVEEAKRIAKEARANSDPDAVALRRKQAATIAAVARRVAKVKTNGQGDFSHGNLGCAQTETNHGFRVISSTETVVETGKPPTTETVVTGHTTKTVVTSISREGTDRGLSAASILDGLRKAS